MGGKGKKGGAYEGKKGAVKNGGWGFLNQKYKGGRRKTKIRGGLKRGGVKEMKRGETFLGGWVWEEIQNLKRGEEKG
ncbi:MAG: hypothetical protein HQ588_04745 [Deltaproteobacteria bacterium]|nr:hypothetical protein [Deltaproteobacteria bacterium]